MLAVLLAFLAAPEPYLLPPGEIVWERRPVMGDVPHFILPTTARLPEEKIMLYCTIAADGRVRDCFLVGADRRSVYAEWSLKAARHFRISPRTRSGASAVGRTVRIPLSFRYSED